MGTFKIKYQEKHNERAIEVTRIFKDGSDLTPYIYAVRHLRAKRVLRIRDLENNGKALDLKQIAEIVENKIGEIEPEPLPEPEPVAEPDPGPVTQINKDLILDAADSAVDPEQEAEADPEPPAPKPKPKRKSTKKKAKSKKKAAKKK